MKAQLQENKHCLDLLDPIQTQIKSIRVSVLHTLAQRASIDPISHHQTKDGLLHGGQLVTDVAIIEGEENPAELKTLEQGFQALYHIPFDQRAEFTKYQADVNLMNIHVNLVTLLVDYDVSHDVHLNLDLELCAALLDMWLEWVGEGSVLDEYPFTETEAVVMVHDSLMDDYGKGNP